MRDLPMGTVTLLFTDIEGSTRLLQQLGKHYDGVLTECRHLLRAAFHQWNGHEVNTQGDSFFAAFARATDAVSAAVDTQRALAAHVWPEGVTVRVRMGAHTGEPTLSAEDYVGLDVHRAARIMSAGHGGQVLLSQTTRDLVEHDLPTGVSLRDLGAHRLKDLEQKSHLYQLVMAGLPADFPPLKTLDMHPHNLPVQPTPLIGRQKEVALVHNLLRREEVRLLTLTGPGGIGKTRMALQVAAELSDRFADGVFFVNLAPISDSTFVVPAVAQTLDLKETGEQPLLDLLKAYLREKQLLLLLDNFEQVLRAASQAADLLAACPKLKIIVTSRFVLHLRGEQEFAVPPLALPDPTYLPDLVALTQYEAVALFIARAQAVKPEFQVTNANARAVTEICVRLDGLPLAIELAAARIKLLPPTALLSRLEHRLQVLTGGAQDAPTRQLTLRNTIEWSYYLLDAQEQRLFRRLSVFVAGSTLEAIEALYTGLGDEPGQVLDEIASLMDKSLLRQSEQEGEELRFVMLETIRAYGLEMLATSGEKELSQRAHSLYYLTLVEKAEPELERPQQVIWLKWLELEYDNLRAALQWSLEHGGAKPSMEMALRLGAALLGFWYVRGYASEGRNFLERALTTDEGSMASVRAKALDAAALLSLIQNDYQRAEALAEESLALFTEIGDKRGIAHALLRLGACALARNHLAMASSLWEQALVLFKEVDDKENVAWSLFMLAYMASQQGEYSKAQMLFKENLALHKESGNKRGMAASLYQLARVLFASQSDPASVHFLLEEGLVLSKELDYKGGIAAFLSLSARVFLHQGDIAIAHSLIEESLIFFKEGGYRQDTAESLYVLASLVASQDDHVAARALYEESLALAKGANDKGLIASNMEGLAGVVAAQGELAWATRLWGAAEALRKTIGIPIWPVECAKYEQAVIAVRTQLSEKTFALAWAQGRTMTQEQVLAAQEPVTIPTPTRAEPPSAPPAKLSVTYPDGLTVREVEVIRLLAQGLTDTQIADHLVISPRMVNTHLKAIYGKIRVSSRSAATRYAMEHQLV